MRKEVAAFLFNLATIAVATAISSAVYGPLVALGATGILIDVSLVFAIVAKLATDGDVLD